MRQERQEEALFAVRIVFLDHVQNLQIHAVRANFPIMYSVGSTAMGRDRDTKSAHAWPIFS